MITEPQSVLSAAVPNRDVLRIAVPGLIQEHFVAPAQHCEAELDPLGPWLPSGPGLSMVEKLPSYDQARGLLVVLVSH